MIYGPDPFPIITTKKIHVSSKQKKIKIDYCLNIPGDAATIRTMLSSPVSDMLYFYFMLLDDDTIGLLSSIRDHQERNIILLKIAYGLIPKMANNGYVTRVRYKEVLQQHRTVEYAVNDLSGDYDNRFRATHEIEFTPQIHGQNDYEDLQTDNLHLVCFTQAGKSPMDPGIEELYSYTTPGGHSISYDLLLQRDETNDRLKVPDFVESYYISDTDYQPRTGNSILSGSGLQPYHGAVHYHGEENPAPDGYIGWMAGPGGDGHMGPKLEVRSIPNYKITSDLALLRYQPNRCTDPVCNTSSRNYGTSLLIPDSSLRKDIKFATVTRSIDELMAAADEYSKENCIKKPNIIDYDDGNTAFINLATSNNRTRVLAESHYGCLMGINFLDIVRHRSRLGYIIDFHRRKNNMNFISECIYRSHIKDLVVKRRRVTNTPQEINERQSKKYTKYEKNRQDLIVVSSSDKEPLESPESFIDDMKPRLYTSKSDLAAIQEIQLMTLERRTPGRDVPLLPVPGPMYSRQFIVRDFDLFHNVKYGKYTYVIDITLRDGIYDTIHMMYQSASRALESYESFLFEAQIPMSSSPSPDQQGNYDYINQEFKESFKNSDLNMEIITSAINQFLKINLFLTGEQLDAAAQLRNYLQLRRARLEDLLEFGEVLKEMIHSLKSFLSLGVSTSLMKATNTEKSSVKNATGALNNIIKVSSPIGVFHRAHSQSTVFADFGLPLGRNIAKFRSWQTAIGRNFVMDPTLGLTQFPERFVSIETSPSDEPEIQKVNRVETNKLNPALTPAHAEKEIKSKAVTGKAVKDVINKGGKIEIISEHSRYEYLSPIQKSNVNIKIGYISKKQKVESEPEKEASNPDYYYPLMIQRAFGGATFGVSNDGINLYDGGFKFLGVLLRESGTTLTDKTKKAICDSAYTAKDKNHFIDMIERKYKDLTQVRDILGSFYESLLSTMVMTDRTFSHNFSSTTYSERYRGVSKSVPPLETLVQDVHHRQAKRLEVVVPGTSPVTLSDLNVHVSSAPVANEKTKLICVRTKQTQDHGHIAAVNDVVFLEV